MVTARQYGKDSARGLKVLSSTLPLLCESDLVRKGGTQDGMNDVNLGDLVFAMLAPSSMMLDEQPVSRCGC